MSELLPSVLVSACLLGTPCRYDGKPLEGDKRSSLALLDDKVRWVPVCPEEEGGMTTPRPAACCVGGTGLDVLEGRARVKTVAGFHDVTEAFESGARRALEVAKSEGCVFALLKARSPSCGSGNVYGRDSEDAEQEKVAGDGVTTALLKQNGIEVFSEEELPASLDRVRELMRASVPMSPSAENLKDEL